MTVAIIGAGMMGSAMSRPLLDNGNEVILIGTPLDGEIISSLKKDNYHPTLKRKIEGNISFGYVDEIDSAIERADLIISGVSSFGVEWFANFVLPKLKKNSTVLAITKGLHEKEDGSLEPFPIYLSGIRPDVSFNAVGGPCISFELFDRISTEVAFCGKDRKKVEELRNIFSTRYYNITVTDDICGIETAVALKNAYAMGVSLAIGQYTKGNPELPEKYNAQAGLFYGAVSEMEALITRLGGKKNALFFGAGDLYVTVFGGRTRRLGTLLGAGKSFSEALEILNGVTLESVAIIKLIYKYLGNDVKDFPFMSHMFDLISEKETVTPWKAIVKDY